jgi:hypothetical protein
MTASPLAADASPESIAAPAAMRLSIAHLLLWIAGTALVVALFPVNWLGGPDLLMDRESYFQKVQARQTLERLSVVAVAPCYGAAIASLLVACSRLLFRRPGFPSLPGHWPLIHLGLWILIVGIIIRGTPDRDFSPYNLHLLRQHHGAALVILFVVLLAAAIGAVLAVRDPWRWRMAVRCHLVAVVVPIVAFLIVPPASERSLAMTGTLVVLCWYIAALIAVLGGLWDFITRERFDLFHWVGVISLLGILAHPPLTWLIADMAY